MPTPTEDLDRLLKDYDGATPNHWTSHSREPGCSRRALRRSFVVTFICLVAVSIGWFLHVTVFIDKEAYQAPDVQSSIVSVFGGDTESSPTNAFITLLTSSGILDNINMTSLVEYTMKHVPPEVASRLLTHVDDIKNGDFMKLVEDAQLMDGLMNFLEIPDSFPGLVPTKKVDDYDYEDVPLPTSSVLQQTPTQDRQSWMDFFQSAAQDLIAQQPNEQQLQLLNQLQQQMVNPQQQQQQLPQQQPVQFGGQQPTQQQNQLQQQQQQQPIQQQQQQQQPIQQQPPQQQKTQQQPTQQQPVQQQPNQQQSYQQQPNQQQSYQQQPNQQQSYQQPPTQQQQYLQYQRQPEERQPLLQQYQQQPEERQPPFQQYQQQPDDTQSLLQQYQQQPDDTESLLQYQQQPDDMQTLQQYQQQPDDIQALLQQYQQPIRQQQNSPSFQPLTTTPDPIDAAVLAGLQNILYLAQNEQQQDNRPSWNPPPSQGQYPQQQTSTNLFAGKRK